MRMALHLHWRSPSRVDQEPICFLWAESSEAPPAKQRGRPAAHPRPRPHPFAVKDGGSLREFLRSFDPGLISQGAETFLLRLPSTRSGPTPSPDLVHDWDLDQSPPFLAPWEITGLRLALPAAIHILRQMDICPCPEHVTLGSDMHYWRKAFNLALEILAQQHYAPTIDATGEGDAPFLARWQPLFDCPPLSTQLTAIAEAMPPVCRAELTASGAEQSPLHQLQHMLSHTCDYLIRAWGAEAPHRLGYLHNANGVGAWLKTSTPARTADDQPERRDVRACRRCTSVAA